MWKKIKRVSVLKILNLRDQGMHLENDLSTADFGSDPFKQLGLQQYQKDS